MSIRCSELNVPAAIGVGEKKYNELKNFKNSKLYENATNLFSDLEIVDIKDLNRRNDDWL